MSGALPDLACRAVGGSVVVANDESFAERENLIKPEAPVHQPATFGHKGQVYDGWETRRRRGEGYDYAIVRLGLPGVVRRVVVDTAFFTGNYPPRVSVQACAVEGYPSPGELEAVDWEQLLPCSPVAGDTDNAFEVAVRRRYTHVRLCMHPDGGVARLRVYGEPVADPRWIPAQLDLAALENGGEVLDCSNMFYSAPSNLFAPGLARVMGEGWETSRRRDAGNDWVRVRLATVGTVRWAELDTTHFKGNAPGWAMLSGCDARADNPDDPRSWGELLPRTRLQPDTRHRLKLPVRREVTHVRMDIYPDGGMARLRLHGHPSAQGRAQLVRRWFDLLPAAHATAVLTGAAGLTSERAAALIAHRPLPTDADLPPELAALLED
jgi:allantoicase